MVEGEITHFPPWVTLRNGIKDKVSGLFPKQEFGQKTISWLLKVYSTNKYLLNTCAVLWASPVTQTVKNLPVMQEAQVLSPGWEDPLEKGMATHSSIPVCRILWTEEPSGL